MANSLVCREVRGETVYLTGSNAPAYSWTADRTKGHKMTSDDATRLARDYNKTAYAADGRARVIDGRGHVLEVNEAPAKYVTGKVEVSADGGSMHTGSAVTRFQLITLRSALKLEKTGLRLSRGVSALAKSKLLTGLRTRDRDAHIARLSEMIAELERGIEFKTEGK